jgi:hypothetical protein
MHTIGGIGFRFVGRMTKTALEHVFERESPVENTCCLRSGIFRLLQLFMKCRGTSSYSWKMDLASFDRNEFCVGKEERR